MEELIRLLIFLFGEPSNLMLIGAGSILIKVAINISSAKKKNDATKKEIREIISAAVSVIIAVKVDVVMTTIMPGMPESIVLLIWTQLIAKNGLVILKFLKSKGIEVPFVLEEGIKKVSDIANKKEEGEDK